MKRLFYGLRTTLRGMTTGGLIFITPLAASAQDWTTGGQNLSNWRNQGDTPISSQNVAKLKTKWVFTTGGDVSATPAVANGIVYFPDFAGNFYAVNASSGALVWQHQLADWTGVPNDYARNDPAVYGGMVILGNQAGNRAFWNGKSYEGGGGAKVMAVDANTGTLKWMTQVEQFQAAMVTSSPVINKGVVYVGIASAEENSASVALTPCCTSRGSVVALDVNTGKILWQTYMVPDNRGQLGSYSGGGVWGSTPVVDVARNSLYVGTGNNYSVPPTVEQCFVASNSSATSCTDPEDYFDSVVALDLNTGKIKWATRGLYYDAWNVNCILTIIPPTFSEQFGPGPNCPIPAGPDFDFGGSGPNLLSAGGNQILGIGEKSGVYWALNPDTGSILWNTQVGPGSSLGGIEWGTATDGKRIYVPVSNLNGFNYQAPAPLSSTNAKGGSWAALDPATGKFLWQVATPGGFMGLGPASVANGVVYVGSMDINPANPTMFALDAKTGNILWSFAAGGSVIAGPAIVGNSIYWGSGYGHLPGLGTSNNKLYAFSVAN